MKNRVAMVTGANGFIGSHLCEALVLLGYQVRAFAHYNSQNSVGNLRYLATDRLDQLEIIFGDIRDGDFVRNAVSGCSVIFHLAALIGIPYSYLAPASYFQTNILGTINILQACRELGVEKLVHTSTSEVYGSAVYSPIDEKHMLQGQSPYSASKIGADKAVESFHRSFHTPVVTLRPFNTFGPRQSERAVIPSIIVQALKQNRIQLGDLSPLRDFNYVEDTVQGFIKAAEIDRAVGETINIGSGTCYTVGSIVEIVGELMNRRLEVITEPKRFRPANSEVRKLQCDYTKAKEMLGYSPVYSLEKGLERTIEFYREHLDKFSGKDYAV